MTDECRRQEAGAERCAPYAVLCKPVQGGGKVISQSGVTQSVYHQIHAQRKDNDLPGRAFQHPAGVNHVSFAGNQPENKRRHRRHQADRHAERLQSKKANQQKNQTTQPALKVRASRMASRGAFSFARS